ncbi:MAG: hypothetical protein KF718_04630 [Polyangiaceae bacterium]|nr:hypothetical protein [Polyangiaceae bacterium]
MMRAGKTWLGCLGLAAALLGVGGCQGDAVGSYGADAQAGAGGGAASGGNTSTGGAGATSFGPGPQGALPSGYCCTSHDQCRYRNCAEFGGVRMCSDECNHHPGCSTGPGMICGSDGYCQPSGTPSCIPAQEWPLGERQIGDCCLATGDGESGKECIGNRCVAFGDLSNPYICTRACDKPADCPVKYQCNLAGFCSPLASLYDCD